MPLLLAGCGGEVSTSSNSSTNSNSLTESTEKEIDYTLEKLPIVIEKITALSPYQDELEHLRKSK